MLGMHLGRRSLVVASIGVAVAVTAGAADAQSLSDIAMMTGPDRQAKLEAGAKKEGEVNFYTALIVNQGVRPLKNVWEKKYPGIKFNYIRASSNQLVQRIFSEARAGKAQADVYMGSISDSLDKVNMLEPFKSPEMAAYPKEFAGEGNKWFIERLTSFGISYNTKLVAKEDIPQTWEDLLNPAFKGKMVWKSSTSTGGQFLINHLQTIWGEKKAGAFFDKLAAQNVALSNASLRALNDLVVAGEYHALPLASLNHVINSASKGAPIWFAWPDPVPTRDDHIMLANTAKNPHAAMLLIDFILSVEGQTILAENELQAARPGIEPTKTQRPMIPELNGKTAKIYSPQDFSSKKKNDDLKAILKKITP